MSEQTYSAHSDSGTGRAGGREDVPPPHKGIFSAMEATLRETTFNHCNYLYAKAKKYQQVLT